MTQKQLAGQMQVRGIEIDDLAILRIEKGNRFVTDYEVSAFADTFQIPIEDLYPKEE